MRVYKFTITESKNTMLQESAASMPLQFYVECKNDDTEQQCFNKIARKFKKKYGVIIESADVEAINEGMWDRLKAKVAGAVGGAKQTFKNGQIHTSNTGKRARNAKLAGSSEDANSETYEKLEKRGSTRQAAAKAKLDSLIKSKIKKINKLIKDIEGDITGMGLELDGSAKTAIEGLKKLAEGLQNTKKAEQKTEEPAESSNATAEKPADTPSNAEGQPSNASSNSNETAAETNTSGTGTEQTQDTQSDTSSEGSTDGGSPSVQNSAIKAEKITPAASEEFKSDSKGVYIIKNKKKLYVKNDNLAKRLNKLGYTATTDNKGVKVTITNNSGNKVELRASAKQLATILNNSVSAQQAKNADEGNAAAKKIADGAVNGGEGEETPIKKKKSKKSKSANKSKKSPFTPAPFF